MKQILEKNMKSFLNASFLLVLICIAAKYGVFAAILSLFLCVLTGASMYAEDKVVE